VRIDGGVPHVGRRCPGVLEQRSHPATDLDRAGAVLADLLEGEVEQVIPVGGTPNEADLALFVARRRVVEVVVRQLAHQHLEHVQPVHRCRRIVDRR